MKRLLLLLFFAGMFAGCAHRSQPNSESIKVEIDQLLNGWHRSAATANFDAYFGALDSLSVYIGTDATEVWSKKQFAEFSKPYFDAGRAWDFKPIRRDVYLNEECNFAWFNETLDTWMGICTASGVLEHTQVGWRIKHYLLSVAVPNSVVNQVVAVKAEADSVLLLEMKK